MEEKLEIDIYKEEAKRVEEEVIRIEEERLDKILFEEPQTKLEWKPKTWKCKKCGAEVGNDYKQCPACWAGPLPMKEIKEVINNYYRENGGRTNRNY